MKSNLRILCISPNFVPQADPEAFCGGKLVQSLIENHIDVFTLYMGNKQRRLDTSKIWNKYEDRASCVAQPKQQDILKSVRSGARYRTAAWARWIDSAVNTAVKLHYEKSFDIIYSRSLPMHAHIAGYWCSKKLKLPWIVNINDPWDLHLFPIDYKIKLSFIQKYMSIMWLCKTLKNAALVIYPCGRLKSFHENLLKINHGSEIIPHIGYTNDKHAQKNGKFRLVHAGLISVMDSLRYPATLLKGMSIFLKDNPDAQNNTELLLIGPEDKSDTGLLNELGLKTVITNTGIVQYEDSLAYIGAANVCVLIEAKMNEGIFLPSKLVDYIVARKPIIALSPSVGTVNDLLPDRGLIRVDQGDAIGVATALAEYYKHYCNGTLSEKAPSDALVNKFMPETVVNKFLSAVNEVIGKKAN